jgi:alpha-glucuronidase
MMLKRIFLSLLLALLFLNVHAEKGYDLWLRYVKVEDNALIADYKRVINQIVFPASSPRLYASRQELDNAIAGLLNLKAVSASKISVNGTLVAGTVKSLPMLSALPVAKELISTADEGYVIKSIVINGRKCTLITANSDIGVLYGVFHFIRLIQTHESLLNLNIHEEPLIKNRVLNHWDNLDGTIERGYAGSSLWDWQRLPGYADKRYVDYARANASVGINGTVLNNVNAKAKSLTSGYIVKAAALADIFRPYGIKVYLTARFTAPIELGRLKTADPLDPEVRKWWKEKVDEIYKYIPDFGGFLIKANSEGQPGPQDYGRSHADGANMIANAFKPHGGIVMWRAFVYANHKDADRAKQAYDEFKPLDGKFADNVLLQVKNGPVDFQPREASHPLFGAMPETNVALEVQITQEYLGFASHLAYLAPLFKETLDHDTYAKGKGSTIAKIIEGKQDGHRLSAIAGVANTGSDINWTGHPFGQANWYAFGRLAWNPDLKSSEIAREWLKMTFTTSKEFIDPVEEIMLGSREAVVNYMMPLGLSHIMNLGTHYGPGPWDRITGWNAWDYHRSDSLGIGIDRTAKGSDAVEQYFDPLKSMYADPETCPEQYLLWFHHVSWDYHMHSGKTLWAELVGRYYNGVDIVREMKKTWQRVGSMIDPERYSEVKKLLVQQEREAIWWRDGCVLYFQTYSKRPIPLGFEKPAHTLDYYKKITFP